jgi:NADPH-dependent 2,4-dienoyl-CoA reductase/sulfur reductase-like enzyme
MGVAPRSNIVVVGASLAGLTAAHELRRLGYAGELTVVGDEDSAYQRPPLSKELLLGENGDDFSSIAIPSGAFDHRTGQRATGLDTDRRLIQLQDGTTLPFDGLVIATGERAKRLEVDHAHLTLRTTADALAIRAGLRSCRSLVVVGGGFLGTEIASIASGLGIEVSVLTLSGVLDSQLGPELSALVTDAAKAQGVSVLTSSRRNEISAWGDQGCTVRLEDGTALTAELAVAAIGSEPNVDWLAGSGLALAADGGVIVDARGRAADGIVAAGDVAAFPSAAGAHARTPYFTSAVEQARVAAAALLGIEAPEYVPTPYFWTSAFGLHIKVAGALPPLGVLEETDGSLAQGAAMLRWVHEGRVTTAAAVNSRATPVKLRRMIGQDASADPRKVEQVATS